MSAHPEAVRPVHLAANPRCLVDRLPLRRISTDATQITCHVCQRTVVNEVLTGTEPDLTIPMEDLFRGLSDEGFR